MKINKLLVKVYIVILIIELFVYGYVSLLKNNSKDKIVSDYSVFLLKKNIKLFPENILYEKIKLGIGGDDFESVSLKNIKPSKYYYVDSFFSSNPRNYNDVILELGLIPFYVNKILPEIIDKTEKKFKINSELKISIFKYYRYDYDMICDQDECIYINNLHNEKIIIKKDEIKKFYLEMENIETKNLEDRVIPLDLSDFDYKEYMKINNIFLVVNVIIETINDNKILEKIKSEFNNQLKEYGLEKELMIIINYDK